MSKPTGEAAKILGFLEKIAGNVGDSKLTRTTAYGAINLIEKQVTERREEVKKLQTIVNEISKRKALIAIQRDKLRDLENEIADVVEDLDSADENLNAAIECFESAIEVLSQKL